MSNEYILFQRIKNLISFKILQNRKGTYKKNRNIKTCYHLWEFSSDASCCVFLYHKQYTLSDTTL